MGLKDEIRELNNKITKCKICIAKNNIGVYPINCKRCNPAIKNTKKEVRVYDKRTNKICPKCKEIKELINFKKSNSEGFNSYCHPCLKEFRRNYKQRPDVKQKERKLFVKNVMKRLYGISIDQYEEMLIHQNHRCAICRKEESRINPKSKKVQLLSVDHCHKTGKVRGLLCSECNLILGKLMDNFLLMESFIKYLKSNF